MGKIQILPESLVDKIAAGEVIERPASVAKELIENSIDAGATQIRVEVEEVGLKRIKITDNGEGMDKEDVTKCFERYATSKISTEQDLVNVKSLGFRGEALSSIAAVSTLTIKSRVEHEISATLAELSGGELQKVSVIGMPVGTSITVENLFTNIPAQKKFLKSSRTEFNHIIEVIMNAALAFPSISFLLSHNGKIVLDPPKNQDFNERVKHLFGETLFSNFIPISLEEPHFKVTGFISRPQLSTKSTSKQYIFVNNRSIKDKLISSSARESYGNLLGSGRHPIFVLCLELPSEFVDVNVHPRKEQVAFLNESTISELVQKAITESLQRHDLTFIKQGFSLTNKIVKEVFYEEGGLNEETDWKANPFSAGILKDSEVLLDFGSGIDEEGFYLPEILQVHNLYLIKQTQNGIMVVDQHAAHERILYEQFLEIFKNKASSEYSLMLSQAINFDLPFSDAGVLRQNIELFNDLGFEIEEFGGPGGTTFKVNSIPEILHDRNIISLINEIIEDLAENQNYKNKKNVDEKTQKALSYLACRSAIKAGQYLTVQERINLLDELDRTKTSYTCPHGRPVKVEINLRDFHKIFKRF